MLVRFVVNNFLSFGKETEFNMLTGDVDIHPHHVYQKAGIELVRTAAIYGANGAGKSNLVSAIAVFRIIIKEGLEATYIDNLKFKLHKKNASQPIQFDIEFIQNNTLFAYGLSIYQQSVEEEYLYKIDQNKEDELIFKRTLTKDKKIKLAIKDDFLQTPKNQLLIELYEEKLLKNNELFLSKYEEVELEELLLTYTWIDNLAILSPHTTLKPIVINSIYFSSDFKYFVNSLMQNYHVGIQEITLKSTHLDEFLGEHSPKLKEEIIIRLNYNDSVRLGKEDAIVVTENTQPSVKELLIIHQNEQDEKVGFDIKEESDGTQRLLDFIPIINYIVNKNGTVIIDEMERSLHPTLLRQLLTKLMEDKNMKGQLIFTTHESNLLDLSLFRQDEIWFVEKDKNGYSDCYPLSDFKPDYGSDIETGYLKGRFGAIPFLGDLKNLNWHQTNGTEK